MIHNKMKLLVIVALLVLALLFSKIYMDQNYYFVEYKNRILYQMDYNLKKQPETISTLRHWILKSRYLDDSCPTLKGDGEWRQYIRWLSTRVFNAREEVRNFRDLQNKTRIYLSKPKSGRRLSDFEHKIYSNLSQEGDDTILLNIRIVELWTGKLTNGGSNFRIQLNSNYTRMNCAVKDFFNGTYISCCSINPKVITNENYTLKVILQFVNFEAYEFGKGRNVLLLSEQFNGTYGITSQIPLIPTCNSTDMRRHDLLFNGYWIHNSGTSEYQYVSSYINCKIPKMSSLQLHSCMKERFNKKFTVLGDSHVRHMYYFWVKELGGPYVSSKPQHHDAHQ